MTDDNLQKHINSDDYRDALKGGNESAAQVAALLAQAQGQSTQGGSQDSGGQQGQSADKDK